MLLWQEKLSDETFVVSIVCIVQDGRPIQLSLFLLFNQSLHTVFSQYLGHLPPLLNFDILPLLNFDIVCRKWEKRMKLLYKLEELEA